MGSNAHKWEKVATVDTAVTQYTVENLKEKSEYYFRVSAENEVGAGEAAATEKVALRTSARKFQILDCQDPEKRPRAFDQERSEAKKKCLAEPQPYLSIHNWAKARGCFEGFRQCTYIGKFLTTPSKIRIKTVWPRSF